MFVVMMLVLMVSAAGIFVAKSSSLEIRTSGFLRQAVQTHFISETGATTVLSRMRTNCSSYFTSNLRARSLSGAAECPTVMTSRGTITPPCYIFMQTDFDVATTPNTIFQPATGTGSARTEGSFGAGGLTPLFRVVVTELGADTSPQVGTDLSDPSLTVLPSRYLIESTGTTELDRTGYGDDSNNVARGAEALRAITVIQCN